MMIAAFPGNPGRPQIIHKKVFWKLIDPCCISYSIPRYLL